MTLADGLDSHRELVEAIVAAPVGNFDPSHGRVSHFQGVFVRASVLELQATAGWRG